MSLLKSRWAFVVVMIWSASPLALGQTIDAELQKNLEVPAQAVRQIQEWNAGFQVYRLSHFPELVHDLYVDKSGESPMAVKADFNGDGRPDFAFFGRDAKNSFVILVANLPKNFVVAHVAKLALLDPKKLSVTDGSMTSPGLPKYIGIADKEEIGLSQIQKSAAVLFFETYGGKNELYQLNGSKLLSIPEK